MPLTLTFFAFCISQAKSEVLNNKHRQSQVQIQVQQEQIKKRLNRIERKMEKRKKDRK